MFRFETLEIWKDAVDYGKKVYKITDKFPKSEQFGITAQLKRASVSISSNIAEGSGSPSNKHFSHFLDVSMESTIETVSQLMFSKELGYIPQLTLDGIYHEAEILIRKTQSFKKSLFRRKNP